MVRKRQRRQRGAALAEAAIGFSVLILLVFGIIEAAMLFQDHELLYNITREATRRMAVGDTPSTAESKALKWNSANKGLNANTVAFTVEQSADASTWTSIADTTQATSGNWVRVRATYSHKNVTGFFGSNFTLPATAVMRVEKGS